MALLGFFPILNFIYWPLVLRSGVLPPHGDSISIPMFGSVLATLLVSPFILGVAWLCLRRYNPQSRLFTMRRDRPIRTIAATVIFGGTAALFVFGVVFSVVTGLRDARPWYEYLLTGYALAWVPWLLGVRAAAIDQN